MKIEPIVREYLASLNDDELSFLATKTTSSAMSNGDLGDFLSRDERMNKLLVSATDADEFFKILDTVAVETRKALKKRSA